MNVGRYEGNDNYGKPRIDYVTKIYGYSYDSLFEETKSMIYLSSYAANNARSDYHWMCDACYDAWTDRDDKAGYQKAYDEVVG